MTEPTDASQPDPGTEFDPELTADLTAALNGATSFFPAADDDPEHAIDSAEHEVSDLADARGDSTLAYETSQYEDRDSDFESVLDDGPLAPSEPAPMPGEPGTAGAALADLAGGYSDSYEPYYGTPSPWSSDRLEAIMRDTVDAQVQEQRQLETLLVDVREALIRLEGGSAPAGDAPAQTDAIDRLTADVAAARTEQEQRFADLNARIDALAAAVPETPEAPTGSSFQDLHDGLAGVRTDMTSLPEQIGPAVTSAVAHGLAETTTQVGALRQSLTDTVTETTELRSLVAAHADHLELLPEAVEGIRDLSARLANLEASAASDEAAPSAAEPIGPELTAIVDEQLGTHLEAFGHDVGEQLNAVRAQMSAVDESLGATLRERLGAFEERLDALHEVLVALHHSEERDLPPALVGRLDELEAELRAMRLANEGPTSPITSVVAQLHASEQRLAHHVDEAVLALAQAVLRRRAGGPSAHTDEVSEPQLPADELAAAARDDVSPDEAPQAWSDLTAPDEDDDADIDADIDDDIDDDVIDDGSGPVEAWTKGDGPDLDDDELSTSAPDVLPGPPALGQDPRRGLFRRRP